MKRYGYYILSALCSVLISSCAKETAPVATEQSMNVSISFQTKAGGSGSGSGTVQEPVINCMRVLIFYGAAQTQPVAQPAGTLLFNTFYAFGFNTTRDDTNHLYNVALANQIVLPQSDCRDYKVYVILNEEGYQQPAVAPATDPTDLHSTLGDFEGNETALRTILRTPAVYAEVLKNVDEPAFLISGYKAVNFSSGELGSGKSVTVDGAEDFNRGRSMAQIVINKITSEPADGVDYINTDVPLIFVKSVTLENIPNTIAWSDLNGSTDGSVATKMASQQVGAANSDGYYTREWYGHVTRTITNLYAQKVQYTDAKLYRTGDNSDPGKGETSPKSSQKWSFVVKPYRSATPYSYAYAAGKDWKDAGGNKAPDQYNAVKGLEAWDKGDNADKSNYILSTQLPGVFDALQDDNDEMSENISYTSYEVTGVQNKDVEDHGVITTPKTSIGPTTLSNDYWTVRLGDKFYVPENIQSAAGNATCIRVRLAIADPKFSFSLNKDKGNRVATEDCNDKNTGDMVKDDAYQNGYNYVDPTTLPSPSSLPGESGLTYTYYAGDSETGNLKQISQIDANWVKQYGSIAWADDETHELTLPFGNNDGDDHGQFNTYIDGFSRRTDAVQSSVVVNETLKGSEFSWNVPASDGASTHVYEYIIPINNNLGGDGDYSVRRNTRYTVTLYVNDDTYRDLSTKAGASTPFTITAKVTTETVDEDEE